MGATGSRSSRPTETLLLNIREYSKLMRAPGGDHRRDLIRFRQLSWDITVNSTDFNEETGVSEYLQVGLFIGFECRTLELAVDVSIEILDHTGVYTVFQRESGQNPALLVLNVRRNELEASSCVRRHDDNFYVRFTVKEQRRPGLLRNWFPSKPAVLRECDMGWGHELTVDSLSKIKAALLSTECVHSTRFTVGGNKWYLQLCPGLAAVRLVRATRDDDETQTTAEFGFVLEGAVNVRSERMTHTFDHHSPHWEFKYQPPPPEEEDPRMTSTTDRLAVRCGVQVIPPGAPSPAAATTVQTLTESVLTPLLRDMQD